MISRPVAGLACKIRVSLRNYESVALVMRDEGHVVRLSHRDPGLSVDLVEIGDFDAAEEYCDRLAQFLDLPPMMVTGRAAMTKSATEDARPAGRRGKPAGSRRPRFLARRRKGEVVAIPRIEGREIIARS